MKRRKGIFWEYNGDGRFRKERIKGFFKRYWTIWLVQRRKKVSEEDWDMYENKGSNEDWDMYEN